VSPGKVDSTQATQGMKTSNFKDFEAILCSSRSWQS